MAKTPKVKDEEVKTAEESATEPTESHADDTGKVSVQYVNPQSGLSVREYSAEIHGKEFKKLAKQFAEKQKGIIL